MIEKYKIAIILRGSPGSGKSTFVDLMRKTDENVEVHAIDDLHNRKVFTDDRITVE